MENNRKGVQIYNMDFKILWAKSNPYKSLLNHSFDVGWTAGILLRESIFENYVDYLVKVTKLSKKDTINTIAYLCALHDIGKCHPAFQQKDEEMLATLQELDMATVVPEQFRHEIYSYVFLKDYMPDIKWDERTARIISEVIGLHHQKNGWGEFLTYEIDDEEKDKDGKTLKEKWTETTINLEKRLRRHFHPKVFVLEKKDTNHFATVLLGILIMSDWIASGHLAGIDARSYRTLTKYKNAISTAVKEQIEIGEIKPEKVNKNKVQKMTQMFPFMKETGLRPLQQLTEKILSEEIPDVMIVEGPMGCGKTEIGMYAISKMGISHGKYGVNVSMPTCATAEQILKRVQDALNNVGSKSEVIPLTGTSWLTKDGELAKWTEKGRMKLTTPNSVSTVDTIMLATLLTKYQILRMISLGTKAVLIDEMHAYDSYMLKVLEIELQYFKMLNVPVVIMSATLPVETKKIILNVFSDSVPKIDTAYPMITTVKDGNVRQFASAPENEKNYRITLEPKLHIYNAIAEKAVEKVKDGGTLCIFCNSVNSSLAQFTNIEKLCKDTDIQCVLINARRPYEQRENTANHLVEMLGKDRSKRPKKLIVVSTQVLEQSIDVDFDYMFSEIAPIDLLLQRIGREHRHSNKGTIREKSPFVPEMVVFYDQNGTHTNNEKRKLIYYDALIRRTYEYLTKKSEFHFPTDIAIAVNDVYNSEFCRTAIRPIDEVLMTLYSGLDQQKATTRCIPKPVEEKFGLFAKRNNFLPAAPTRLAELPTKSVAIMSASKINLTDLKNSGFDIDSCAECYKSSVVELRDDILEKTDFELNYIEGKNHLQGTYLYTGNDLFSHPVYGVITKKQRAKLM